MVSCGFLDRRNRGVEMTGEAVRSMIDNSGKNILKVGPCSPVFS
jgi:hypothetical protein